MTYYKTLITYLQKVSFESFIKIIMLTQLSGLVLTIIRNIFFIETAYLEVVIFSGLISLGFTLFILLKVKKGHKLSTSIFKILLWAGIFSPPHYLYNSYIARDLIPFSYILFIYSIIVSLVSALGVLYMKVNKEREKLKH